MSKDVTYNYVSRVETISSINMIGDNVKKICKKKGLI